MTKLKKQEISQTGQQKYELQMNMYSIKYNQMERE